MKGLDQLMALSANLMDGLEKKGKLMVGVGNEGFAADGR